LTTENLGSRLFQLGYCELIRGADKVIIIKGYHRHEQPKMYRPTPTALQCGMKDANSN